MYAEVAKIYGKDESSICEIAKKEKETHVSFAVAPQSANIMATVGGKCLLKMKKALNLWVEDMNRKYVLTEGNKLCQETLSIREHDSFSTGPQNERPHTFT